MCPRGLISNVVDKETTHEPRYDPYKPLPRLSQVSMTEVLKQRPLTVEILPVYYGPSAASAL